MIYSDIIFQHYCGYVGVTPDHPWFKVEDLYPLLPDADIHVHGGVTYHGNLRQIEDKPLGYWWFGFDCGHGGDRLIYTPYARKHGLALPLHKGDVFRDANYVSQQCEDLATQLTATYGDGALPTRSIEDNDEPTPKE